MNGIDYLLDTNAIIYLLAGNSCMEDYLSSNFALSIISKMEVLSFNNISIKEEYIINNFLNECNIINLNNLIVDTTIILRKNYKIKIPDAIVAATSIYCDVPLITADKGFSKIKEIKLELITPCL